MQLKKEPKFNKFLSMMEIFKKNTNENILIEKSSTIIQEEKEKVKKEIDFIISSENIHQLKKLTEKDISLSFEQFFNIVLNKPHLKEYIDIEKHVKIYEKKLKDSIEIYFKDWSNRKYSAHLFPLTNFILENIEIYQQKNEIENLYKNSLSILYFYDVSGIEKNTKISIKNLHEKVENIYNIHKEEDIENLVQRSKILEENISKIKENIFLNLKDLTTNFSENDLSKEGKNLFNEIKNISLLLSSNQLDTENNLQVNNLVNKRIPQVIAEYIKIPENYREQLKVNKENPDSLLIDSLTEIKMKLKNVLDVVQDNNLNNMKITNKYLKNM